jgi:DNA gyrase subunit A
MSDNNNQLPDDNLDPKRDKIVSVNIEEQMKAAYIDYSMSVIVSRALPDVRDGLKPVHRRILYAMNELGLNSNKPHKKSARIVGEVLGKYHPHGDTAVYDTMVRMAQDWSMRYLMVDGQGNYGSQDGDGPAAMRYTEARLKKLAESMLEDLEKDTVDFRNNFDDSLEEPTVLPTRIPQLLINGSSGIAVGMATNMLPHNLSEVIDGCIAYVENKEITAEELLKYIPAPDFPTKGTIFGMEGVRQGMLTGRGRVVLRGKITSEVDSKGREKLIITEVPYQVSRDSLTDKIAQLVNNKIIDGIADVNNQSNKDGTRIVIDLKRDGVASVIINQLYKHSELQTSFGINNVALVGGRPKILNIRDLVSEFIHFRHEVVVRRTKFELAEAEKKAHILEGYLKALDNLDEVIKIIRESRTPDIAKENLIKASQDGKWLVPNTLSKYFTDEASYQASFGFSDVQAKAILELRLQRLTGMEQDKIVAEYEEIMKNIAYLRELLANESMRYGVIKDELLEIKQKFGDERRTEIQYLADEISIEDLIEEENVVITISHLGYIKRTSASDYKAQRRGGRGSKGSNTREEDWIDQIFVASTHHTLLFFTEKGRAYWLKVHEIADGAKAGKGRAIQNMIQLPPDDKVRAILDIKKLDDKDFVDSHYIVLCTKQGIIKKTALSDFSRPRQTGVNAITIVDGDQLLEAKLTDGNSEILLAVKSGRAIRFPEEKVRPTGRGAIGVQGIEVDETNDEVVGLVCVNKEEQASKTILVVSEKGFGKRTLINDAETGEPNYRVTNRGGKGVKTINVTEKTGSLVGMLAVSEEEDLMITCESGIMIRMAVKQIREAGRATQGVTLIKVGDNDSIAAITNLPAEDTTLDEIEEGSKEGEVTNENKNQASENQDDATASTNDTTDIE